MERRYLVTLGNIVRVPGDEDDLHRFIDFIPVSLWYAAAINTAQYCDKGDAICVKGRLVQKVQEINGINYHFIELVGERVVFLSSKNKAEDLVEEKYIQ